MAGEGIFERLKGKAQAAVASVGNTMGQAAADAATPHVRANVAEATRGVMDAVGPKLHDVKGQAWEGAKNLAGNPYVQGGAGAALALYGGSKAYDAWKEHKLRSLSGDYMAHQNPGFAGAHELGGLMARARMPLPGR
jgi:hypothetical protein